MFNYKDNDNNDGNKNDNEYDNGNSLHHLRVFVNSILTKQFILLPWNPLYSWVFLVSLCVLYLQYNRNTVLII